MPGGYFSPKIWPQAEVAHYEYGSALSAAGRLSRRLAVADIQFRIVPDRVDSDGQFHMSVFSRSVESAVVGQERHLSKPSKLPYLGGLCWWRSGSAPLE